MPDRPIPVERRDALSDVLRTVRLTGALFFLWDVSWPFAMPVPDGRAFAPIVLPGAQSVVSFHLVTEGRCWAAALGDPPVALHAGDVLLVPWGAPYVMASSPDGCVRARLDLEQALPFYRQMASGELPFVIVDGVEPLTHVICGFLGCDVRPFNPVLGALPAVLRVPPSTHDDALPTLTELAVRESRSPRPGSASVLHRLSELMFVEVLRRVVNAGVEVPLGTLAGLTDPTVGRALAAMHADPTRRWTVAGLARAAGASRTRFAAAFAARMGLPPMQYLAQWRMQIAATRLRDPQVTVAKVAAEVGYASEAAFSRAFKRIAGCSPAAWRRTEQPRKEPYR